MKSGRIGAIITARGGSTGLPRKNVLLLAGKPLIAHSILAARGCRLVHRCWVSTEDSEIKDVSLQWGAQVLDRPAELAVDDTLSRDVVRHALQTLQERGELPDHFVLLQPTSPLRTAAHLTTCLEGYLRSDALCAISVCEVEHHPYKDFRERGGFLEPLFDEVSLNAVRQSLPRVYRQNGAIYVMGSRLFLDKGTFYVRPALPFRMTPGDSVDIDSEIDLRLAEWILDQRGERATG